jgi:hypothetical protein
LKALTLSGHKSQSTKETISGMSSSRICNKHYNPKYPWEAVFSEDSEGWSTMAGTQVGRDKEGKRKVIEVDMDVCGPCNGVGEMPDIHGHDEWNSKPVKKIATPIAATVEDS